MGNAETLVDLRRQLPRQWQRSAYAVFGGALDRLLGVQALNEAHRAIEADRQSPDFFSRALRALRVSYEFSEASLGHIPASGPLIVVSNHPLGALDGIVAGAVLTRIRTDTKLMGNYLLGRVPGLRPWLLSVDPFERPEARAANHMPLKQAIRHLREGGCLVTFPSGTVSHWQWDQRRVTDPAWSTTIARLARKAEAPVLPLFFEGRNSCLFQMAGAFGPSARLVMLPREMARRRGTTLKLRIGRPITPAQFSEFPDPDSLTEFLRMRCHLLAQQVETGPRHRVSFPPPVKPERERRAPVSPSTPTQLLRAEIEALPPERRLASHGEIGVFLAHATEAPSVLAEIGRLRELTFREVGEGTGQPSDLDRFDLHYGHLFLWDAAAERIAGAYRIGRTDEIVGQFGLGGLYTSTLFRFRQPLLDKLGPALEMGRSFIVPEYQRKKASLALLWRGIGAYVVQNPRYATLFGPVSISQEYQAISRDLMVKFLSANRFDSALGALVRARRPHRGLRGLRDLGPGEYIDLCRDLDDVSALISEIEHDGKGVPTLLRHYLKLNGQLLAFNVDPSFGHCLDGLIVVDLRQADRRLLTNYMGAEGLETFLAAHEGVRERR